MPSIDLGSLLAAAGGAGRGIRQTTELRMAERLRAELAALEAEQEERSFNRAERAQIDREGRQETRDLEKEERDRLAALLTAAASSGTPGLAKTKAAQESGQAELIKKINRTSLRKRKKGKQDDRDEIVADIQLAVSRGLAPSDLLIKANQTKKIGELKSIRNEALAEVGKAAISDRNLANELTRAQIGATDRRGIPQPDKPQDPEQRDLQLLRERRDTLELLLDQFPQSDDILILNEGEVQKRAEVLKELKIISDELEKRRTGIGSPPPTVGVDEGEKEAEIRRAKELFPDRTAQEAFDILVTRGNFPRAVAKTLIERVYEVSVNANN